MVGYRSGRLPGADSGREWDSPLLFKNHQGRLVDQTQIMGLADAKGCWSGLASGDFDEDGRIDWIAGNWGLNGPHAEHLHHPLVLYHGLLNQDPVRDVLQAHWEPSMETWFPMNSWALCREGSRN